MQTIRITTLADAHREGYHIAAFCPQCRRNPLLDLAALIAQGRGNLPIRELRVRCRVCGERRGIALLGPDRDAGGTVRRAD